MSEPLTLYVDAAWVSPYALSAFVALEEKGLPYTVKEVSLPKKEHHQAAYQSHTGRVPALQHGDWWLSESSAIAEYLAEVFPAPSRPRLFPEDLRERALCREIQAWVRSDMLPIRTERPTSSLWQGTKVAPLSPQAQAAAERLIHIASRWVPDGKTSLFGSWCIADTDLGVMLQRLNLNGDPLPPKLAAFAQAQWDRPSVRKWTDRARPAFAPY